MHLLIGILPCWLRLRVTTSKCIVGGEKANQIFQKPVSSVPVDGVKQGKLVRDQVFSFLLEHLVRALFGTWSSFTAALFFAFSRISLQSFCSIVFYCLSVSIPSFSSLLHPYVAYSCILTKVELELKGCMFIPCASEN